MDSAKVEIESLKIENKNLEKQINNLRDVVKSNENNNSSVLDAYKSEISNLNIQFNKIDILNQKLTKDIKRLEERKDYDLNNNFQNQDQINNLKSIINNKDTELSDLKAMLDQANAQSRTLEEVIKDNNIHINKFKAREADLNSKLADYKTQIEFLNEEMLKTNNVNSIFQLTGKSGMIDSNNNRGEMWSDTKDNN